MSIHTQAGTITRWQERQTGFHAARYNDDEMAAIADRHGLRTPQVSFSVGYESPSKFAIRFKNRFGFAPSSLRLSATF